MDNLSMNAAIRVPLLLLTDHDAFAPTWYSGDGQSKVPLRWDTKDVLNALYVTMPMIEPDGKAMWDSLQSRYARSFNLLGALHSRAGFAAMTNFAELSSDYLLQQTSFANGWTVVANFDSTTRSANGITLPTKGFLAQGGGERIERNILDGAERSRVRLSDRWFLDPEGTTATVDGIRTSGSVFMRRENDTTVLLSFVGTQSSVDILPLQLAWPATQLRAVQRNNGASMALTDAGSGWLHLDNGGQRFVNLIGDFGAFIPAQTLNHTSSFTFNSLRMNAGNQLSWNQRTQGTASIQVLQANGKIVAQQKVPGVQGANQIKLPKRSGVMLVQLCTPDGCAVRSFTQGIR